MKYPLMACLVLLTFLDLFAKTHLTVHDGNHGLVSNSHERYLVDQISSLHEELSSAIRGSSMNELNSKFLKFEPKFLDFQQRPLGVPHLEKVTLFNVDRNKSIDMTSISGSTVHFHSSFFENKRIPPLGNTSFNVIFLGREEGAIESNLFIHTTEGHFKYQVKGASVSSPYRLRPIVGVKLPINTTFSPLIYMYNPHAEAIQIVEIYSSGGDFHLELPSGELEGPKNMWEIPAMQRKAIIRVRFHSQKEQNHTAYVRIKLNNTEDILVVPLEVEVTPTAGLFMSQGSADFGVGGSLDIPKQFDLLVNNPLKRTIKIHSISTASDAIKIDYESGVKIPPEAGISKDVQSAVKIATLKMNWKVAFKNKEFSGKIIIKYRNKKTHTEIPYYVTVLEGGLLLNATSTSYFINNTPKQFSTRQITVKNNFLTPLAINNVSLSNEAQNYFITRNFKPRVLRPGEDWTIFGLGLKPGVKMSNVRLNTVIFVYTNVSIVRLPLLSYNGKLKLKFPYKSKENSLDLGLLSLDIKKEIHFLVLNKNPVPVNLYKVVASLPASAAQIVDCKRGNYTTALAQDLFDKNMIKCNSLNANEYAIIRLSVLTPRSEGQVWGDVTIETQFERLTVPIHYKVANGKLEIGPDRLVFDQCFPGKICSHPLKIHSTFNEPMMIENIVSIPPDPRLSSKHLSHIMARSTKTVGHLYLDPTATCSDECYSSLQIQDRDRWLQTLALPTTTPELDLSLVNMFYNRYLNETEGGLRRWQNLTMRLDTSKVKLQIFKTRVRMSWPSLVVGDQRTGGNGSIVKFLLTQVGNISYRNITIRNPSSQNLIVQLVLHHNYVGFETLNEGLPPNFIPGYSNYEFLSREGVFFFDGNTHAANNAFKSITELNLHESSLGVFLSPGENFTLTVGFRSKDAILNSALLYIRNNLTIIEVIQLNGQGAIPNFKFGSRKPGSLQPLPFELTDRHLKECENKEPSSMSMTVKRTFTARNLGDISISVEAFFINGLPCEGYGFRVLNCEPFVLLPNTTKKIEIAFTPDFTTSKVLRMLSIQTSLNYPVNFTLLTTIPPSHLSICTLALARPIWESYLFYVFFYTVLSGLLFVIMMVYIDGERIIQESKVQISKSNSMPQSTFDLKSLGAQTQNELRTPPKSEDTESLMTEEKKEEEKEIENDIIHLMDDQVCEKSPPKPEAEKYTALIPTVGKSKKRMLKKTENLMELPKKTVDLRHKPKGCISSDHESTHHSKRNFETKEVKKAFLKKINIKQEIVNEENVSPVLESQEDVKPFYKKSPVTKSLLTPKVSIENYTKESVTFKPETKRPLRKYNFKREKEHDARVNDPKLNEIHKPKSQNSKNHHNKERTSYIKKSPVERKLSSDSHTMTNSCTMTRFSPTTQSNGNIWMENRATFSDVVARSESALSTSTRSEVGTTPQPIISSNSSTQTSVASTQTSKPFMLVEPYQQAQTDLGPIGSMRRTDYQHEHMNHNTSSINNYSNSFFSDIPNVTSDNTSSNVLSRDYTDNIDWNIFGNQQTGSISNILSNDFGFEDSNFNARPASDTWNPPSSDTDQIWGTQNNTLTNSFNLLGPQVSEDSRYLWGSSTVWQPPSQPPRTPTRIPPGFRNSNRNDFDESQQQQRSTSNANQSYDLFGLNNMWSQQYPNPWNSQREQQ